MQALHYEVLAPRRKPSILLIEDNEIIQLIHRKYLEKLNCNVSVAANGTRAMELFKSHPDLVLLDIGLPDVSGIEICSIMRQQENNNHTPIVALTAFGDEISDDCAMAGFDDLAAKPISIENLKKVLQNWLPEFNFTT